MYIVQMAVEAKREYELWAKGRGRRAKIDCVKCQFVPLFSKSVLAVTSCFILLVIIIINEIQSRLISKHQKPVLTRIENNLRLLRNA